MGPDFAERASYKVVERSETAAVRKAVIALGNIVAKRENMLTRIIKEFRHITHEDVATLEQVSSVLLATGNKMDLEDLERAATHLMPTVDPRATRHPLASAVAGRSPCADDAGERGGRRE